jgi:hypothetical protein
MGGRKLVFWKSVPRNLGRYVPLALLEICAGLLMEVGRNRGFTPGSVVIVIFIYIHPERCL